MFVMLFAFIAKQNSKINMVEYEKWYFMMRVSIGLFVVYKIIYHEFAKLCLVLNLKGGNCWCERMRAY